MSSLPTNSPKTVFNPDFLNGITEFQPKFEEPLSSFSTWKVGGPAEILVIAKNADDLEKIVIMAIENQIPYTILGHASNVLISDLGLRGFVIINKSRQVKILESQSNNSDELIVGKESEEYDIYITPRHTETGDPKFYSFADLDYEETGIAGDEIVPLTKSQVVFDSGVGLSYSIAWSLQNGLTGLQWFAGIPGTMGGALYNNIHGGTRHFSDNFVSCKVLISK